MKQPIRLKSLLWVFTFGVAALFSSATPFAQTVFVDQPLSFGRFVVVDFDDSIQIIIENDGNYVLNSNVYVIDEPTLGEYTLQDAPANTAYTITVPSSVTIGGGPGGSFILDEIKVKPDSLSTDVNGEDNFTLSGRLRSAGGGTHYGDGTYSNNFTIIFNF